MIALNLTATTKEHTILKNYLESNVSAVLADKINNGVRIEKDGKTLVNKKDLAGFMSYACGEAQKQADKGARSACIEDKTVFGWAIHYFEENSIEGTLYNEDGTEYKPKPVIKPSAPAATKPAVKPNPQISLFDMISTKQDAAIDSESTEQDELDEPDDDGQIELTQISETAHVDKDGVIHEIIPQASNVIPDALQKIFGSTLIAR